MAPTSASWLSAEATQHLREIAAGDVPSSPGRLTVCLENETYELRARLVSCEPHEPQQLAVALSPVARCSHSPAHLPPPTIDCLTGLLTRTALANLQLQWNTANHSATPFAVFFVDLNAFKHVNDRLGHRTGDDILRAAADRLRGAVRPHDLVVRYGGDEFVVVATEIADESVARHMAQRIAAAVKQPLQVAGEALELSAAIGYALGTPREATLDELIDAADFAMLRMKRAR